ncbi:MAG: peptidoglycan-binding protein [Chthoniobacterales bacterium]|nr:peptidoglycan-binding protein [Chthoniobacterales bacterium]
MKHFFLAALLGTFALPNAASFAQSEDEARAGRAQQYDARRNAAIERMIAPSTRAQVQQQQPQVPRVERPQRSSPGGGRQFNATPRVRPERPSFSGNPGATAQPRPRREWQGSGGAETRDRANRTRSGRGGGDGIRNRIGRGDIATNPDVQDREGFTRRNWQNRDGGTTDWRNHTGGDRDWHNRTGGNRDWHNRSGGNRDWHNRGGERNLNRGGNWSHRHRHWDRTRRDRGWWRSNFTNFILFGGGYYYLHNNYWYPAYGYDPYFTTYVYNAPLYAYNGMSPQQVIAEVQAELQRQGYYRGGVDGSFGLMTRRALLGFQEDNGLPVTGEIDEETLAALGFE